MNKFSSGWIGFGALVAASTLAGCGGGGGGGGGGTVTPPPTPSAVAFATVQGGVTTNDSSAPAPYTNSGSGVNYDYFTHIATPSSPQLTLQETLNYTPQPSDLRTITIEQGNNQQIYTLTAAQITQAVTVSGNTITFNSANLTGGNALSPALPAMVPGDTVIVNTYVNTVEGNQNEESVVQITGTVPNVHALNQVGSGNYIFSINNQSN